MLILKPRASFTFSSDLRSRRTSRLPLMTNENATVISAPMPVLSYPMTTPGAALGISTMNKRASTAALIVVIRVIIPCPKNSHGPSNPYNTHRVCANYTNTISLTESMSIVCACDDRQPKHDAKRCQQYYYLSHIDLLINNNSCSVIGNNRSALLAGRAAGLKLLQSLISQIA